MSGRHPGPVKGPGGRVPNNPGYVCDTRRPPPPRLAGSRGCAQSTQTSPVIGQTHRITLQGMRNQLNAGDLTQSISGPRGTRQCLRPEAQKQHAKTGFNERGEMSGPQPQFFLSSRIENCEL